MAPRALSNNGSYTDFNLNYVYGCQKVDPTGGCMNCYIHRYYKWYRRKMEAVGASNPYQGKFIEFIEKARLKALDKNPHNSVIFRT